MLLVKKERVVEGREGDEYIWYNERDKHKVQYKRNHTTRCVEMVVDEDEKMFAECGGKGQFILIFPRKFAARQEPSFLDWIWQDLALRSFSRGR